ncbi:MAG: hypothetical protein AVDCRST_MAG70-1202 [uncultured Thermomicrobiales bacterium]|uniref:UspA domain-containing protein n=1 Tax=uncultured Thermomicrobiales bacterium TaxID=1645740 RepID=A0A6J4UMH9_9BACT|nr:MAG: hypothetical protein AVDCRST_MAG70-1202 [uncultured Thermomicrobiales bacterium]
MPTSLQNVVVPLSGGVDDERILDLLGHLADRETSRVTLVYVVEVLQSMTLDAELPTEVSAGEAILSRAERLAAGDKSSRPRFARVTTEILQARTAGAAIVDEAVERHADAIVLAATIRKIHGRITLGDTVEYVLKHAPCEVILIREPLS